LRRKATWLSDDAWVIDDEAHLETGRIERRQRVCRLEQPDLIRVTADDLPEGAEVHLSDEGYRIPAYRALARIGPLLLPVRCDDVHRVAADRTLVDEIVVRFLGMPVARIEVHARLGDGDAAGEELFAARA
jgi:hypothetical protein